MDRGQVEYVLDEKGIGVITINHPPVNSLSSNVINQLTEIMDQIENDPNVNVLIVTGKGSKAFVAGANIKEFPDWIGKGKEYAEMKSKWLQHPFNQIERLSKPTIAALNGLALGGGCELALSCDLRVAQENVLIGLPEITLGLFPGAGGTQRLPRLIGEGKAKELMFFGEPVMASEAKQLGLVNMVVPEGQALEKAKDMAEKLSKRSFTSLSLMKKAINEGRDLTLEEGLELEAEYFGQVFQTEDVKEGVAAFIEKREPKFIHK